MSEAMPSCLVHAEATVQGFARTGDGSTARHIRCSEADGRSARIGHFVLYTLCNPQITHFASYRSGMCQMLRSAPICPSYHRTMWLIVGHCDAPAFALIAQCGP